MVTILLALTGLTIVGLVLAFAFICVAISLYKEQMKASLEYHKARFNYRNNQEIK